MNLKKWLKKAICDFIGHTFSNPPTHPTIFGELKCRITINRCDRCENIVAFPEDYEEEEKDIYEAAEESLGKLEDGSVVLQFRIDNQQKPIKISKSEDVSNIEIEVIGEFGGSRWDLEAGKEVWKANFVLGSLISEIEYILSKTSAPKEVLVSSTIMDMIKEFNNGQMTSSLLRRLQRPILPGIIP